MTSVWQAGHFVAAFAALAACDQGHRRTPAPSATGSATNAPRDAADDDAAPFDTAAPAKVTLPAKPTHGCLGWSRTAKTVACITGRRMTEQPSVYTLEFVSFGEPPPAPLDLSTTEYDEAFEPAVIAAANDALWSQAIEPFPEAPREIDAPGTHVIGKTVKLIWTSKLVAPGGDNLAPTYKHVAVARCGGRTYELVSSEANGVDPTFTIDMIDGHTIIETLLRTAREGEYGAEVSVLVLDLATCNAAPSFD